MDIYNNQINILIMSDPHVGFSWKKGRKNEVCTEDSLVTMVEILEVAKKNNVDLVLVSSNVYDVDAPKNTEKYLMNKIFKHANDNDEDNDEEDVSRENFFHYNKYGNKVSREHNFKEDFLILTVSGQFEKIPLPPKCAIQKFSIKDPNQVDPEKSKTSEIVTINPTMYQKNDMIVAVYCISYFKKDNLQYLITNNQLQIKRPKKLDNKKVFHILMIHQRRGKLTGDDDDIGDDFFPDFLDFVIWGYHHESLIEPIKVLRGKDQFYFISQPGSTVATSISEKEPITKNVGLLKLTTNEDTQKIEFNFKKIPLKTVRCFFRKKINVMKVYDKDQKIYLENIKQYIDETMIPEAAKQFTGHISQPRLPVIVLILEVTMYSQQFNTSCIAKEYRHRVANPDEMITFHDSDNINSTNSSTDDNYTDANEEFLSSIETTNQVSTDVPAKVLADVPDLTRLTVISSTSGTATSTPLKKNNSRNIIVQKKNKAGSIPADDDEDYRIRFSLPFKNNLTTELKITTHEIIKKNIKEEVIIISSDED